MLRLTQDRLPPNAQHNRHITHHHHRQQTLLPYPGLLRATADSRTKSRRERGKSWTVLNFAWQLNILLRITNVAQIPKCYDRNCLIFFCFSIIFLQMNIAQLCTTTQNLVVHDKYCTNSKTLKLLHFLLFLHYMFADIEQTNSQVPIRRGGTNKILGGADLISRHEPEVWKKPLKS